MSNTKAAEVQKPKSIFWVLNSFGWLAVTFINIFFQTEYFSTNFDAVGYSFVITAPSFLVTLLIRYYILKFQINEKPIGNTIPYLSIIAIIATVICVFTFSGLIVLIYPHQTTTLGEIARNLFQFGMLIVVWILLYGGYLFFENQQKLIEQKLTLSLKLKEAELNTLRKQLSPHFLFNSLNNIRSLIRIDPEKAREAILNISDLLRYVLNYQKKEAVTVEEEMEIVQAYMELNSIHLEENVNFKVDIEPSIYNLQIPPLSIQLLIENALKHGEISNGAIVSVRGYLENTSKILTVSNPGKLELQSQNGIGLNNLKFRLSDLHKNRVTFDISQTDNIVTSKITFV